LSLVGGLTVTDPAMRQFFKFIAILLVLAPLPGLGMTPPKQTSSTSVGRVSGRIFHSGTGKGYAGVMVVLNWKPFPGQPLLDKMPDQDTTTDADGNFKFENVTPTRYYITASIDYKPGERPPCGYFKDRKINDGNRIGILKDSGENVTIEHILSPTFDVDEGSSVVKNFDMKCRLGSRLWPF
jgi:hypothetical protein